MKTHVKVTVAFLILLPNFCFAQEISRGIPFIRNYSPYEYKAYSQNMCIAQDSRGIMYFGNYEDGILEYDGEYWKKIPVKDNLPVLNISKNIEGTLYVGLVGDFGYLKLEESGIRKYHSWNRAFNETLESKKTSL